MADGEELLHKNLHEVFSERDPDRRWEAIEETYAEDVTFIDPEGEVVGRRALSDRRPGTSRRRPSGLRIRGGQPQVHRGRRRRAGMAFRAAREPGGPGDRHSHDPQWPRERSAHLACAQLRCLTSAKCPPGSDGVMTIGDATRIVSSRLGRRIADLDLLMDICDNISDPLVQPTTEFPGSIDVVPPPEPGSTRVPPQEAVVTTLLAEVVIHLKAQLWL
jgi:hypothetical protein